MHGSCCLGACCWGGGGGLFGGGLVLGDIYCRFKLAGGDSFKRIVGQVVLEMEPRGGVVSFQVRMEEVVTVVGSRKKVQTAPPDPTIKFFTRMHHIQKHHTNP